MVMYTKNGVFPIAKLPYRIEHHEMFNGRMKRRTYTAEAVYNNYEKLGYTEVSDQPAHDAARQSCDWNADTLSWDVADYTDEHLASMKSSEFSQLRQARNQKLLESDWSQLLHKEATDDAVAEYGYADRKITKEISDEWETYRQELRDLPAETDDARLVTWPSPPFLTGFEPEDVSATSDGIV